MKMLKLTLRNGEVLYMNPLQVLTVYDDNGVAKGARIYAGPSEDGSWHVKETAHEVARMWGDATKD